MKPFPGTFADVLRGARYRRRLTLPAAAAAAGVALNTLQRIESGKVDCYRQTAVALVRFYDLPAETLLLA